MFENANGPLTSVLDTTAEVCGVVSACEQAISSDQAQILQFDTNTAAAHELTATDDIVAGRYIVRWATAEAAATTGDRVTRTLQLGHPEH